MSERTRRLLLVVYAAKCLTWLAVLLFMCFGCASMTQAEMIEQAQTCNARAMDWTYIHYDLFDSLRVICIAKRMGGFGW